MPFKKPWERSDNSSDRSSSSRFNKDNDGGFKKPWERSERSSDRPRFNDDSRPPRRDEGGFKKPWERSERSSDRPERSFDRPRFNSDSRPPRRDEGGFKKPWERSERSFDRSDRPARSFDRPRFNDDDSRPSRPPRFSDNDGFKKPFKKSFDKPFRKPWDKPARFNDDDSRPPRRDDDGFRKPFKKSFDKPYQKPWEKRDRFDGENRTSSSTSQDSSESGSYQSKPKTPTTPEGELLYGRQPVRETLRAERRVIKKLIIGDHVKDTDETAEIKTLAEALALKIEYHKKETLEAWTNGGNHQGVVAVCEEYPYADSDEIIADLTAKEGSALVIVLDHIVDPQNLGSLIRTCEAAGAVGIFLPVHKAAEVTPAAVRASAGAAEHMKISRVSNLVSVLEQFKQKEVWITGLEALPEAKLYTEIDYKGKTCIVIGSEGNGISTPVRKACDNLVRLPLNGQVDSLNAGVAGAIAIYEVLRQNA